MRISEKPPFFYVTRNRYKLNQLRNTRVTQAANGPTEMPQYLPRKLKQNQRSETHCPILPRTQPEMESLAKTGPIPNHNAIKPRKAHSNKKEKEIAQPHSTKEHGITRSGRRNPNDSFARAV